jgi:hypothetical protein
MAEVMREQQQHNVHCLRDRYAHAPTHNRQGGEETPSKAKGVGARRELHSRCCLKRSHTYCPAPPLLPPTIDRGAGSGARAVRNVLDSRNRYAHWHASAMHACRCLRPATRKTGMLCAARTLLPLPLLQQRDSSVRASKAQKMMSTKLVSSPCAPAQQPAEAGCRSRAPP